jgi:hypothetical protein
MMPSSKTRPSCVSSSSLFFQSIYSSSFSSSFSSIASFSFFRRIETPCLLSCRDLYDRHWDV